MQVCNLAQQVFVKSWRVGDLIWSSSPAQKGLGNTGPTQNISLGQFWLFFFFFNMDDIIESSEYKGLHWLSLMLENDVKHAFPGIIWIWIFFFKLFLMHRGKCLILAILNLRLFIYIWLHHHLGTENYRSDIY